VLIYIEDNVVVLTIEAIVSIYFAKYSESISETLILTKATNQMMNKEKLYFEQLQMKCLWDKSISGLCKSSVSKYKYFEEFYKSKIVNIAFLSSSPLVSTSPIASTTTLQTNINAHFFQALKAIELMSVHLEWDWMFRIVISRHLSSILSSQNPLHSAIAVQLIGTVVRSALSVGNISAADNNVIKLRSMLSSLNYDISLDCVVK
jgi:hypothetical protein